MITLRLFLGDSEQDETVKKMLDTWIIKKPEIILECQSIHANPSAIVRLGITDLPALVLQDEIIVQGSPENWVLPLLDRAFVTETGE